MPAHGQAIENFVVPKGPVACTVGIPCSVVSVVTHPIQFKIFEASEAVVGTNI